MIQSLSRLRDLSRTFSSPALLDKLLTAGGGWQASRQHSFVSKTSSPGLLEMRTYLLDANGATTYIQRCDEFVAARMDLGVGFLG